jgi:hypothetical protein
VRHLQFQHHYRDDDGDDAIAERSQPISSHVSSPTFPARSQITAHFCGVLVQDQSPAQPGGSIGEPWLRGAGAAQMKIPFVAPRLSKR